MQILEIIDAVRDELEGHYPKAALLFGSAARYLHKVQAEEPGDFDLLFIGTFSPKLSKSLPVKIDIHAYTEYEIMGIARSLRYSPRFLSRAKMYMQDTWHGTVRSDIIACLLLGPSYADYGFMQMENEDKHRDYSIHEVIIGRKWWRELQAWTQEHRGPGGLLSDKVLGSDRFKPDLKST